MGTRRWYAWKRSRHIYGVPSVTSDQARQTATDLANEGEVLLDDRVAHAGALTLYRQQLTMMHSYALSKETLAKRVHRICQRPGLELTYVEAAVPRRAYWAWIPPSLVTHGGTGAAFKPYHHSTRELANMSRRLLQEDADSEGLLELFGDPRSPSSGIVVSRLPGPLGPVYPITVNGNHRSIALEALGVPAILAEVAREDPPYQLHIRSDVQLSTTWLYLTWLHDHGALRIGSRRITRKRGITVHITTAVAPWIIGHPASALRALAAYESIKGERLVTLGPLAVSDLRRTWRSVPEPDDEDSGVTFVHAPDVLP
jgi:hypothetical protein